MGTNQLERQTAVSQRNRRRFPWGRFTVVIIAVITIVIMTILQISSPSNAIFVIAVLTAVSILISLFQWLFPVPVEISDDSQGTPQTRDGMASSERERAIQQRITVNLQEELSKLAPVFFFNEPLPHIQEFYGRVSERNTIINRAHHRASTSIVGPRRIGKTWLLEYTKMLLSEESDHTFLVGHLDASTLSCKTVSQFTNLALEALSTSKVRTRGLDRLESFVKAQRQNSCIPVLLIDEFEGLTKSPEFNLDFFSGLRSIANAGLVLVTASRDPLLNVVIKVAGEEARTSPFFNVFEQITLKQFVRNEAEEFAYNKTKQAKFTVQERGYLLKHGEVGVEEWSPLRLQLTGKLLQGDKILAPGNYRPNDPRYWQEFEQRLEDIYRGVVR